MKTAYAMLAFNHRTKEILGWIVLSSDDPATSGNVRYARLYECSAMDWELARDSVTRIVRQWFPGLGEPSQ